LVEGAKGTIDLSGVGLEKEIIAKTGPLR